MDLFLFVANTVNGQESNPGYRHGELVLLLYSADNPVLCFIVNKYYTSF